MAQDGQGDAWGGQSLHQWTKKRREHTNKEEINTDKDAARIQTGGRAARALNIEHAKDRGVSQHNDGGG